MKTKIIVKTGTSRHGAIPTIIKWKGTKMIASHSIRAAVMKIIATSKNLDVVKIGLMGQPASGKSTLAETLAHLIHTLSYEQKYVNWTYRIFGQNEFLNLNATLDKLDVANYILYFHDLSFLKEHGKIVEVKQVITKIRHLREDVKIILIFDYHYTKGLDKYLRQADYTFFTSVGQNEIENMIEIVGQSNKKTLITFRKKFVEAVQKNRFFFKLGKQDGLVYRYKDPFVVALFWDNSKLRHVIFPKRTWIDQICQVCAPDTLQLDESLFEQAEKKYGSYGRKAAIRVLAIDGLHAESYKEKTAFNFWYRAYTAGKVTPTQLMDHYGLSTESQATKNARRDEYNAKKAKKKQVNKMPI